MRRREGGAGPPRKAERRPGQGGAAQLRTSDADADHSPSGAVPQHPVQLLPFRALPGRHRRFLLRAAAVHGQRRIEAVLGILPETGKVSIADVLDRRYVGVVLVSTVERNNADGFLRDPWTIGAFQYGAPLVAAFELERDAREAEAAFRRTRRTALDQIAIRETGCVVQ
jgi:hypothetical protein